MNKQRRDYEESMNSFEDITEIFERVVPTGKVDLNLRIWLSEGETLKNIKFYMNDCLILGPRGAFVTGRNKKGPRFPQGLLSPLSVPEIAFSNFSRRSYAFYSKSLVTVAINPILASCPCSSSVAFSPL